MLSELKWHRGGNIKPEFFCFHLISILREISNKVPSVRKNVTNALLGGLQRARDKMSRHQKKYFTQSRNFNGMMYGILRALSKGMILLEDEKLDGVYSRKLYDFFNDFIKLSFQLNSILKLKTSRKRLMISMNVFSLKIILHLVKKMCRGGDTTIQEMDESKVLFLECFKTHGMKYVQVDKILVIGKQENHAKQPVGGFDSSIFIDFTILGISIAVNCARRLSECFAEESKFNVLEVSALRSNDLDDPEKSPTDHINELSKVLKYLLENTSEQMLQDARFVELVEHIIEQYYGLSTEILHNCETVISVLLQILENFHSSFDTLTTQQMILRFERIAKIDLLVKSKISDLVAKVIRDSSVNPEDEKMKKERLFVLEFIKNMVNLKKTDILLHILEKLVGDKKSETGKRKMLDDAEIQKITNIVMDYMKAQVIMDFDSDELSEMFICRYSKICVQYCSSSSDENGIVQGVNSIFGIHSNLNDLEHKKQYFNEDVFANYVISIHQSLDGDDQIVIKKFLLKKTMKLFNKLATKILKGCSEKTYKRVKNRKAKFISCLLRPIAIQLQSFSKNTVIRNYFFNDEEGSVSKDTEIFQEFRKMWFFCVVFGFVEESSSASSKIHHWCQVIAQNSPFLVDKHSKYSFDDLRIVINHLGFCGNLTELKKMLKMTIIVSSTRLAGYKAKKRTANSFGKKKRKIEQLVAKLDFAEVVYILGVFHLESLRVMKDHTLNFILVYLGDHSININSNQVVYDVLQYIIRSVFLQWLDYVTLNKAFEMIENETCNLIQSFPSRMYNVQRIIKRKYLDIMSKFTFLFWSQKCFGVLLDLFKNVFENVEDSKDKNHVTSMNKVKLMFDKEILLPQTTQKRRVVLTEIFNLLREWIQKGLFFAPSLVKESLQRYFLSFKSGYLNHIGYTVAMMMLNGEPVASSHPEITQLFEKVFSIRKQGFPTKRNVQTSKKKKKKKKKKNRKMDQEPASPTTYQGPFASLVMTREVKICRLLCSLSQDISDYSVSESMATRSYCFGVIRSLLSIPKFDLCQHIDSFLKEKGEFEEFIKLLTAYLIMKKEIDVENLQKLIWHPFDVDVFGDKRKVKCAVVCWNWLLSSREEYYNIFLRELTLCWENTIKLRWGVFSGKVDDLGIGKNQTDEEREKEVKNKEKLMRFPSQLLIVNFISNLVSSCIYKKEGGLESFANIIINSLKDLSILSNSPLVFILRMRLVFLSLNIARLIKDKVHTPILRKLAYQAIGDWFCEKPKWWVGYPCGGGSVSGDLNLIRSLIKVVKKERKECGIRINDNSITQEILDDEKSEVDSIRSQRSFLLRPSSSRYSLISLLEDGEKRSGGAKANLSLKSLSLKSLRNIGIFPPNSFHLMGLLILLLEHEKFRIQLWFHPQKIDTNVRFISQLSNKKYDEWVDLFDRAWEFSPELAFSMYQRFRCRMRKKHQNQLKHDYMEVKIRKELGGAMRSGIIGSKRSAYHFIVFDEKDQEVKEYDEMSILCLWKRCTMGTALKYLSKNYTGNRYLKEFALRSLKRFTPDELLLFLPQFVQLLRYNKRQLRNFLLEKCKESEIFSHQLIWQLRNEIVDDQNLGLANEEYDESEPPTPVKEQILKTSEVMIRVATGFIEEIVSHFDDREKELYSQEFDFFSEFTKVSLDLMSVQKEERNVKIRELKKLLTKLEKKIPEYAYLPNLKDYRVKGILPKGGITLKSSKKVPILVPFRVQKRNHIEMDSNEEDNSNSIITKRLIFKDGDDVRMDQIAIQFITLFQRVYVREKLPLFLYPYKIIPTGPGRGIIEVIPSSTSIHDLKGKYDGSLMEIFQKMFGNENGIPFKRARKNFIESLSAYSIITYLLNVKDRHNGNIMIDDDGRIIHIDFGFILQFGPGKTAIGTITIENLAPFKFTREMIDIICGMNNKGEQYELYVDLLIRAYLITKDYSSEISDILEVLSASDLPCFGKNHSSIQSLRERFSSKKTEEDCVNAMIYLVNKSDGNIATRAYDEFQFRMEGIRY